MTPTKKQDVKPANVTKAPEAPKAATETPKPEATKEVKLKEPTKAERTAAGFVALIKEKRPTITNIETAQEGSKIVIRFGEGGLVEVGKGGGLAAPMVKSYPKATPEILIFADEMLAKQTARAQKKEQAKVAAEQAAKPKAGQQPQAPA